MEKMNDKIWNAVMDYQVPGCVNETPTKDNISQQGIGVEWSDHVPGTTIFPNVGNIFLGMPKLFSRLGIFDGHNEEKMKINIFEDWDNFNECFDHGYNKFNVPVWKYLNDKSHTFIRGLMPRINRPFLHVILENVIDKIDCYEITEEDMATSD